MKNKTIFILIIIAGLIQFACKKNDGGGPPTISNVRAIDTTKRDSFFVRAIPGTLIVIQGNNLGGVQAVFFNDTLASFNPVYNTNTNLTVTIPATAQTAAANPNVQNIIKVVTDHGTVTYSFTLYLPPPSISSISLDNSGTLLTINGFNFQGIKKITFPVPGIDTALGFTVNKTFTQIMAVIPPGNAFTDSLRVYCTFGTATFSYPPPMTITSVSNENGGPGTTLTIYGTNFIGVKQVLFPGGLSGANLQSISVNQLTVTVPSGITTVDSLRLNGILGNSVSPHLFASYITHPSPGYLSTFDSQNGDNTGFVGWTGGYADAPATATNYPGGTGGSAILLQSSPMPANAGATTQGNPGLLQLNGVPWVANTALPISNYSLKFEVYVKTPWSAGEIWIAVGDWYGWTSFTARYAPWTTASGGVFQPSGWVTATIPLSQFYAGNEFYKNVFTTTGKTPTLFSDFPKTALVFMIANDQPSAVPSKSINIAIDNVRIVKGQ